MQGGAASLNGTTGDRLRQIQTLIPSGPAALTRACPTMRPRGRDVGDSALISTSMQPTTRFQNFALSRAEPVTAWFCVWWFWKNG